MKKSFTYLSLGLALGLNSVQLAQASDIAPRIINGSAVNELNYPWMVSVQTSYGAHFCGGVLIHPEWVLTAAHCMDGETPENIQLMLNTLNLNTADSESRYDADRIIIHPRYDSYYLEDDIALVHLKHAAKISSYMLPLSQADTASFTSERAFIATGWGSTTSNYNDITLPSTLMQVDLRYQAGGNCSVNGYINGDSQFCAVSQQFNADVGDTCFGDSGGPLFYQNNGWRLAGLVSFGQGNVCNGYGGYTKVTQYWSSNSESGWVKVMMATYGSSNMGTARSTAAEQYYIWPGSSPVTVSAVEVTTPELLSVEQDGCTNQQLQTGEMCELNVSLIANDNEEYRINIELNSDTVQSVNGAVMRVSAAKVNTISASNTSTTSESGGGGSMGLELMMAALLALTRFWRGLK